MSCIADAHELLKIWVILQLSMGVLGQHCRCEELPCSAARFVVSLLNVTSLGHTAEVAACNKGCQTKLLPAITGVLHADNLLTFRACLA